MGRKFVLLFCVATVALCGMQTAEEYALDCLWEETLTCSDVQTTNCTLICCFKPIGPGGVWRCRVDGDPDGAYFAEQKVVKNSYTVTVESDEGICEEAPQQDAVFCATTYNCHQTCGAAQADELCDVAANDNGTGTGRQVRPKIVDIFSGFCPDDCVFE